MAKADDTDLEVRDRLRGWLRYYRDRERQQFPLDREFAEHVGISPQHLSLLLKGSRTAGLDVVLRLHRTFHVECDRLLDSDAPGHELETRPEAAGLSSPGRKNPRHSGH